MDKEDFWRKESIIFKITCKLCNGFVDKVEVIYNTDDLFQECWMVYDKCLRYFKGKTKEEFVSLYKTAAKNRLLNLKRKKENGLKILDKLVFPELIIKSIEDSADFKMKMDNIPHDLLEGMIELIMENKQVNSRRSKELLENLKKYLND